MSAELKIILRSKKGEEQKILFQGPMVPEIKIPYPESQDTGPAAMIFKKTLEMKEKHMVYVEV